MCDQRRVLGLKLNSLAIGIIIACSRISAFGGTTGLNSITQISGGTTIDFEGSTSSAAILAPYGITADSRPVSNGPAFITTFVPRVTGNADAPVHGNALFSPGLISTTSPWSSVGISLTSSVGAAPPATQSFTFTAYDQAGNTLYTHSHSQPLFIDSAAYNASMFFEGVTSSTPIYSFLLTSNSQNFGADNLTFISVPEPATFCGAALFLTVMASRRPRRPRI